MFKEWTIFLCFDKISIAIILLTLYSVGSSKARASYILLVIIFANNSAGINARILFKDSCALLSLPKQLTITKKMAPFIKLGAMYILPECNASIKSKSLNEDDTKSPNNGKF